MANSDYRIGDQTGASFLTDINGQLNAIRTNNSKVTAPVGTEDTANTGDGVGDGIAVGMLWYNSSSGTLSTIPAGGIGVCTAVSGSGSTATGTWVVVQTGPIVTADITDLNVTAGKMAANQDLSGKASQIGNSNTTEIRFNDTSGIEFVVNGTVRASIDSSGNFKAEGDVSANNPL